MRLESFEEVDPSLATTGIDHSDKTPEEEARQDEEKEKAAEALSKKARGDGHKPTSKRKASSKTPKSKKPSTKPGKSSKKKASAPKKSPRKAKSEKAPKPKKGPGRGIRADGKPRRKPGTNPPSDEKAAAYGRKIAKARKAKGWTQRQLAEKVGLTQPGVANIERGVCGGGKEETQKKFAKVLGL